jgi:Na+-transporting NADH:ubiquinone oxidoreductase subunit NqrB
MIWWTKPIANSISDSFFILSTLVFIIAGIFINKNNNKLLSQSNKIAIASFISLILFMILLSISFDFGNCENPSRMHPYFVSGRLISGALIPFGMLYLQGMNIAISKIENQKIKLYILTSVVAIITTLEYINHIPVFESKYNFFNL